MSRRAKWLVPLLALWLLTGWGAIGCGGKKNLDNFRQVKMGWTQEQVRGLLGEPDRVEEAAGLAGVWEYHGRNWHGAQDSTLIVTWLGGRVMMATLSSPTSRP